MNIKKFFYNITDTTRYKSQLPAKKEARTARRRRRSRDVPFPVTDNKYKTIQYCGRTPYTGLFWLNKKYFVPIHPSIIPDKPISKGTAHPELKWMDGVLEDCGKSVEGGCGRPFVGHIMGTYIQLWPSSFSVNDDLCSKGICSQCSFKAQFESALTMHHQLHHESSVFSDFDAPKIMLEKSNTVPRVSPPGSPFSTHKSKGFRLAGRTSSATRLFNNLKARICRSRMLFSHPEESQDSCFNVRDPGSVPSECTSKAMKVDSIVSRSSALTTCIEDNRKETFGCHLCSFEADRITVLDRHLLNDHKIGLENLLKLVMAKTKDGLSEDNIPIFGIRQPYYKLQDEIFEEGEFIIETIEPKIKILKHASTNTENSENIEDFKAITTEIEKLFKAKQDGGQDGGNFMSKMETLNEYMCKFVNSSNTLKKALNKELDSKINVHMSGTEPVFNLGLGDKDTPRDWERAHSEKLERSRKYSENSRCEKGKMTAESFYF